MVTQNNTAIPVVPRANAITAYGHGWNKLWPAFGMLLLIGIVFVAISFAAAIPQGVAQMAGGLTVTYYYPDSANTEIFWLSAVGYLITIVIGLLVTGPIGYGVNFAFLKASRSEAVEVVDMFRAFKNYGQAVLAGFLVGLIAAVPAGVMSLFVWLVGENFIMVFILAIVMIIMGVILIIVQCKLAFVPFLIVDKKMKATEAIKASWNMTSGHAWQVFFIGLLAIPAIIAGLICFLIGVVISIMWVNMAIASLYYAVDAARSPQPQPVVESPPAPPII